IAVWYALSSSILCGVSSSYSSLNFNGSSSRYGLISRVLLFIIPKKLGPIPTGHVIGYVSISNVSSISSNSSNGSLPMRSSLLINVNTGMPRIFATLNSFNVCGSIPSAASITITALSTAINVRYVSSEKSSCPGVSRILTLYPSKSNCMTELVTEIPRSCSTFIQSEVANLPVFLPLTTPASRIAPPNNNSFSVNVVFLTSGCELLSYFFRLLIFVFMSINFLYHCILLKNVIFHIIKNDIFHTQSLMQLNHLDVVLLHDFP